MRLSSILGLAATATTALAFVDYESLHTRDIAGLYDRGIEESSQLYARDPEDYEGLFVRDIDDLYELYARDYNELLTRMNHDFQPDNGQKHDVTVTSGKRLKGKKDDARHPPGILKTTTFDVTHDKASSGSGSKSKPKSRRRRDTYWVDEALGYDY
ncbi:hypothetical protein MMC26_001845 [Xylographa opegraphella]|nr:hypothetical protein [Xylographa opegraphella]